MSDQAILTILNVALVIFVLIFVIVLIMDIVKHKKHLERKSSIIAGIIGLITGFFDAFKIGSFALTIALLRATKQCDDEVMPGTLNASHTIPVAVLAFLFFRAVKVDPVTLIAMISASVTGAFIGASFMSKLSKKIIRIIMGLALLAAAVFMLLGMFNVIQSTGGSSALTGIKLIIGVVCNFFLGVLMTAGVELYVPCMALVYFLGMSADAAFPIMMGSYAFSIQVAGIKFIKEGRYARKTSLVINILGCFGVIIAFIFFKNLSMTVVKWVIIAIILYTAVNMMMVSGKQQRIKNSIK